MDSKLPRDVDAFKAYSTFQQIYTGVGTYADRSEQVQEELRGVMLRLESLSSEMHALLSPNRTTRELPSPDSAKELMNALTTLSLPETKAGIRAAIAYNDDLNDFDAMLKRAILMANHSAYPAINNPDHAWLFLPFEYLAQMGIVGEGVQMGDDQHDLNTPITHLLAAQNCLPEDLKRTHRGYTTVHPDLYELMIEGTKEERRAFVCNELGYGGDGTDIPDSHKLFEG